MTYNFEFDNDFRGVGAAPFFKLKSKKMEKEIFNSINDKLELLKSHVIGIREAVNEIVKDYEKDRKITKKEACKILGCTYPTLITYIKSGDLKTYKVGNSEKLSEKEVNEYLNR